VVFEQPVSAITPGQAAVAYDLETGKRVLAGGWIVRRLKGDMA
jgi:tRNA U34 2-thiouridine synthase MnmA/TrmU